MRTVSNCALTAQHADLVDARFHGLFGAGDAALQLPEPTGRLAQGGRGLLHDGEALLVLGRRDEAFQRLDAAFLCLDRLVERLQRGVGGGRQETEQGRLQPLEVADVFNGRARHGHVSVQHPRGVETGKTDARDQKDQRYNEQKNLGDDPAALQQTIQERHCISPCMPAAPDSLGTGQATSRFMQAPLQTDQNMLNMR